MGDAPKVSWRDSRLLLLTIFLIALSIRLGAVLYLGVPDIVEAEEQGLNAARLVLDHKSFDKLNHSLLG